MLKRTAQAVWHGDLMKGSGVLDAPSGILARTPYSFPTRFGDEVGTNPEELIAAAHAGCYCMALTFLLEKAGMKPHAIRAAAELTVVNRDASWTVTGIELTVTAQIPGATDDDFQRVAQQAKTGCLVSRLVNAPVSLHARLEPGA